jgi:MscS family membrane protein
VVTVPNAEFASIQIENFARRDRIRFYTKLGLRYETTPDQMRYVLAGIKRLLASHPMVDPDPARVRFIGFGNFSLDVEIFAFVNTTDFNEYLGVQEDLLLRLMELVNDSGSGFAFPSSTTYLGKDSGLNLERQQKAEAQVRTWREEGRLPFPSFTPEALAEMDDTLDYPPKGSAVAPTQPL